MGNIAIITARGGSKRIPRKNIKDFCGKPIIAYSIEAAINSGCFDEVMVSTDDEEIAEIARKYGAKVPFMRSEKTSNDYATTIDVLLEVLAEYQKLGQEFEYLCCIYPTAPFVTHKKLKSAMEIMKTTDSDSLVPIVQYGFPPQRCFVVKEGNVSYKWPENMLTRSQDLEPLYHDCGQFYCMNCQRFLDTKKVYTDKTYAFVCSELEVQDIDNLVDWQIAEMKYKLMLEKEKEENV